MRFNLDTGWTEKIVKLAEDLSVWYFSLSPDGQYIAAVEVFWRRDLPTREERTKTFMPYLYMHIAESARPSRGHPYYKTALIIIELETGSIVRVAENCDTWKPPWFPDSQTILFGMKGHIFRYSLVGEEAEKIRPGSFPTLSPNGTKMAYFANSRFCWGPATGEEADHIFDYQKGPVNSFLDGPIYTMSLWSPDGKYILLSNSVAVEIIPIPPFIDESDVSEIYILNASKGNIVYQDRIPDHHKKICWVERRLEQF
jgi:Tol biopolymer transport system component